MTFLLENHHISEPLLRAVISTAVDGIMIIDERGIVRSYNAACERLFGYLAEEVVGHNINMLMPAPYRDEHDGYLETYRRTGQAQVIGVGREVTGQRKDGSQFPIRVSVGEAWHREQRYFVGIVHDITTQKLTEEHLLKTTQEAEAANRAKSDFLAVVSHEIRSPLHAILGTASLLLHTALDDKQRQYAATIQQSGETLLNVVNNILDLAKIEAGHAMIKEAQFEIKDLLESIEFLWESRVKEKDLEYFTQIARGVPPAVIGDADRLRETLNNLVNNAIKFTDRGYISVRVDVDDSTDRHEDGPVVLRFAVKDTGIGIEPDCQKRLFERFEQMDTSLTREHGGSGLGLAICKELCQLFGGEIGVDSEPGKGSRFWFTVPCKAVAESGVTRGPDIYTAPDDGRADDLPRLAVLVAEDDHPNQVIIRDILEHAGHIVDIVPNGREAVRAAERNHYDMILMDVRMPLMDGLEATRKIRYNARNSSHVPIIALTAHAMAGDRQDCLAAGMDDYISKPFTIAELNNMIAKYAAASALPNYEAR